MEDKTEKMTVSYLFNELASSLTDEIGDTKKYAKLSELAQNLGHVEISQHLNAISGEEKNHYNKIKEMLTILLPTI